MEFTNAYHDQDLERCTLQIGKESRRVYRPVEHVASEIIRSSSEQSNRAMYDGAVLNVKLLMVLLSSVGIIVIVVSEGLPSVISFLTRWIVVE